MSERFVHETGLFESDSELLDLVVPFVEDGVVAGQPTLLAVSARHTELLGAATDLSRLTVLVGADQYVRPAITIRTFRRVMAEYLAAGVEQVRVVGEIPDPGPGWGWDAWVRYEAVANHAFADLPLWAMCVYDTEVTPLSVLAGVRFTHELLAAGGGCHDRNPDYVDPEVFLAEQASVHRSPVTRESPAVELIEPTPAAARRTISYLGEHASLDAADLAGLVISVSEAVGNAMIHGRPPVLMQAWVAPGRVEVAVHDAGPGPTNPFVGMIPEPGRDGNHGLGLWIAHQLCSRVILTSWASGFTIRLIAGDETGGRELTITP
jgi:anti-sigma regulatory factor (Ser/Thr protein kinase)